MVEDNFWQSLRMTAISPLTNCLRSSITCTRSPSELIFISVSPRAGLAMLLE
jgi:hypothetical protein